VIDRASGATVTDITAASILTAFAGISVVNAGHCNSQVVAAAKAQMDKLVHCSSYLYHVRPVADLAEKNRAHHSGQEAHQNIFRQRRRRSHRRRVENSPASTPASMNSFTASQLFTAEAGAH